MEGWARFNGEKKRSRDVSANVPALNPATVKTAMKWVKVSHHASTRNDAQYKRQPMGSMARTPKRSKIMP